MPEEFNDDTQRYIEFLQKQMLQEGWSDFFSSEFWSSKTADLITRIYQLPQWDQGKEHRSAVSFLEKSAQADSTSSRYNTPTTQAIFQKVFEEVTQAAAKMGLRPTRPVRIVTSTEIASTPAAWPTTGEHLLFVGLGTSSYCNYWAKAITGVIRAIPKAHGFERVTSVSRVESAFRHDSSGLLLAGRLALHYAMFGTLIGFGKVEQLEGYMPARVDLVSAMERFSLSHEYAHFLAHERFPAINGVIDPETSLGLERFCDEMGLQISREIGSSSNSFTTFCGIGALAFFRTIELCTAVRALLKERGTPAAEWRTSDHDMSHPSTEERIAAVRNNLVNNTDEEQGSDVVEFFDEYDVILRAISKSVISAISEMPLN